MNASLIDGHCHLDFPALADDIPQILDRMASEGVERIVIPGVRKQDWQRVLGVAGMDGRLSPCLGIHPWYVAEHDESDIALLDELIQRNPQCVGLGECGLDKIYGDVDEQLPLFEAQVELARQRHWPLVIHSVRTHEPVVKALGRQNLEAGALIHAFAGSPEQADQLTKKGLFLGVGGVITYSRARKSRQAVREAPLSSLILETDAPDMPPQGVEKGDNTPLNLKYIFDALCDIRPEEPEVIRAALKRNAYRFFRL